MPEPRTSPARHATDIAAGKVNGTQKKSLIEDILDLTAKAPWWVGVALAVATYITLSITAAIEPPTTFSSDTAQSFVHLTFLTTFSKMFRYLLPCLFLLGAIVSFIKQQDSSRRRRREARCRGWVGASSRCSSGSSSGNRDTR